MNDTQQVTIPTMEVSTATMLFLLDPAKHIEIIGGEANESADVEARSAMEFLTGLNLSDESTYSIYEYGAAILAAGPTLMLSFPALSAVAHTAEDVCRSVLEESDEDRQQVFDAWVQEQVDAFGATQTIVPLPAGVYAPNSEAVQEAQRDREALQMFIDLLDAGDSVKIIEL